MKKKFLICLIIFSATYTFCACGNNTTATQQQSEIASEASIKPGTTKEETYKQTTLLNIAIGREALGLSTSTNIESDSCKNYELFGYIGDFSFSTSLNGQKAGVYDKMYWSTQTTDSKDCLNNVISYYGNKYEFCDYSGYKDVYVWKDTDNFESIVCWEKPDIGVTMIWTSYDGINAFNALQPQNPTIGMTAEEVENSTWGKPYDINKTITNYSISEQWVYKSGSNFKYIYFEDGIVTAIQE